MALKTSTERSRERRARIKADAEQNEQAKKRERERWKKRAAAEKLKTRSSEEIAETRRKIRDKVSRYRAKKKANCLQVSPLAFRCNRSFGKTLKRVIQALPRESLKKVKVVASTVSQLTPNNRKAVFECDSSLKRRKISDEPRKSRSDATVPGVCANVVKLYERDDISRMCPGKKEYVTVHLPEGKEVKQCRMIVMTSSEMHTLYQQEYPDDKVGLSSFRKLRPYHVQFMKSSDQYVCKCIYHEKL